VFETIEVAVGFGSRVFVVGILGPVFGSGGGWGGGGLVVQGLVISGWGAWCGSSGERSAAASGSVASDAQRADADH